MGTDLVIGESQQVSKVYVVEGLLSSSNWFLVIRRCSNTFGAHTVVLEPHAALARTTQWYITYVAPALILQFASEQLTVNTHTTLSNFRFFNMVNFILNPIATPLNLIQGWHLQHTYYSRLLATSLFVRGGRASGSIQHTVHAGIESLTTVRLPEGLHSPSYTHMGIIPVCLIFQTCELVSGLSCMLGDRLTSFKHTVAPA